jgi:hypothetical protein
MLLFFKELYGGLETSPEAQASFLEFRRNNRVFSPKKLYIFQPGPESGLGKK